MSARRLAACFVVAALVLAAGAPAVADVSAAKAHYERGRALFQVSEYRKAIEEFKAAHVEKPDPAFLYNIAECYRLLAEPKDAALFYHRFLTQAPPGSPAAADARRRLAELEPPAPPPTPAPPPAPVAPLPRAAQPPPTAPTLAAPAPAPAAATLVAAPPPPLEGKPFYKRGWFVFTVAVVVVAGALGVTWALTTGNGTSVPDTTLGNRSIFKP
jgi:tetratricopeptide (TPR) repeat protein